MATPKSTVKSTARSEQAKKIMSEMPRDPATGRLMKRAAPPADPAKPPSTEPPAGGPAAGSPFGQPGRGIRRFRRPTSG